MLGPVLFSIYTTPLCNIFRKHHLNYHGYADDNQLYLSVKYSNVGQGINDIENCIKDLSQWMASNFLKLNSDKTELILIGTSHQLSKVDSQSLSLTVAVDCVAASKQVKNLGVVFSQHMSPDIMALNTARTANFHLASIGKIRKYLDMETCKIMIHAYVTSRLDYCNSLLAGSRSTSHLQRIQNKAARIVTRTPPNEHITPVLKQLHWLPVRERVIYKILSLTHSTLYNENAPVYLKDLLKFYSPPRPLRSQLQMKLTVPASSTRNADRAFSRIAPALWNGLPLDLRCGSTYSSFQRNLKTFLFRKRFN